MRRWISVALATLLLSITAGPAMAGGGHGCDQYTDSSGPEVAVENNCFRATVTRVAVGDTVTWVNHDEWQHNIVTPAFQGTASLPESYSVVFDEAGVYPYVCTLHYGMVGAIVVGDAPAAAGVLPVSAGSERLLGALLLTALVATLAWPAVTSARRRRSE